MQSLKRFNVLLVALIIALSYANAGSEKESDDSVVPDDPPPEEPAEGEQRQLSESAIAEYLQEHPEVKQMPTRFRAPTKMKHVFNKFGDVVAVPDPNARPEKPRAAEAKGKASKQQLRPYPPPPFGYPFPYGYGNPFAYPMNPMMGFNPMMSSQTGDGQQDQPGMFPFLGQSIGQPMDQTVSQQFQQSVPPGAQIYNMPPPMFPFAGFSPYNYQSNDTLQSSLPTGAFPPLPPMSQYPVPTGMSLLPSHARGLTPQTSTQLLSPQEYEKLMKLPKPEEPGPDDQNRGENEVSDKMAHVLQMVTNNGTEVATKSEANDAAAEADPSQADPTAPQFLVNANQFPVSAFDPMNPMAQPFNPFQSPQSSNGLLVDKNRMQFIPMPVGPNDQLGMDPNVLRQLESGRARLDMANARVIPLPLSTTTEEPEPLTESDSLDDRPELPEVVLPKPTPKPKPKPKPKGRKQQHRRAGPKKPKFLMRARLNNLPKNDAKAGKGKEWWTKPAPNLCEEPIIEITDCPERDLQKRWSFNPSDEKCYLYEDYCHSVKTNTFKTLKDCMTSCWRPK